MTDLEVERVLGYTPCICGVIDGTWHRECYMLKRTPEEREAAYRRAFSNARRHLSKRARDIAAKAMAAASTPPNPKD